MPRPRRLRETAPGLLETLHDMASSTMLSECRVTGADEFEAKMRLALAIWRVLESQKPEAIR